MSVPVAPRVLVIDDDTLFLEIVRFNLERTGCRVEAVSDPREGLNRAIESDFSLILLDLMMPGLNGEEVLRLLKPLGRRQPVLVVSAHNSSEYQARVRDLGAVGYIQKPVDSAELCRVVEDLLQEKVQGGEQEDEPVPSRSFLDRLTLWVFDSGTVTPLKRLAALGVLGMLLGVLLWLILA